MARIRTIKPEFPQSESVGRLSRDARLCFIMLWTIADDSGRLRGSSRMLASLLFPYDDDARSLIGGWLFELEAESCIARYAAKGDSYIQICNWLNHQRIDHPSKSKFPEFAEASRGLARTREDAREDLRIKEGTKDQGRDLPSARNAPREPKGKKLRRLRDEPEWITEFKAIYPTRAGDQGWSKALRAANARMAEGHELAEMMAGARRYRDFCLAKGDMGTEYVKQAATFLGPDKPFLLPWHAPPKPENAMDRLMRMTSAPTDDRTIDHVPEFSRFIANS